MNRQFLAAPTRLALCGLLATGVGGGLTVASGASASAAPAAVSQSAGMANLSASQGASAVRIAASKKGSPYRWGATGPRSFDCSGLVSYTMKRIGKSVPRTADGQYRASTKISRGSARPGDLVFYGGARKTHVGVYAGNGRMWHAPRTGDVVKLSKVGSSASFGRVR